MFGLDSGKAITVSLSNFKRQAASLKMAETVRAPR
jgi:hypothetical protein